MLQEVDDNTIIVTRDLTNPGLPANGIPIEEGHIVSAEWANNETLIATVIGSRYVHFAKLGYGRNNERRKLYEAIIPKLIKLDWEGASSAEIGEWEGVLDTLDDDPEHILLVKNGRVNKLNINTLEEEKFIDGPLRSHDDFRLDKNKQVRYVTSESSLIWAKNIGSKGYYKRNDRAPWEKIYDFNIRLGAGKRYDEAFENRLHFAGFSDQENIIYILSYDENGRRALFTYDIDSKQKIEKIYGHDTYDLSYVVFEDDGSLGAYYYNGEKTEMVPVSQRYQRLDRLFKAKFPDVNVSIISKSKDNNKTIFMTYSPTEPGAYYLLDFNSNTMVMLGYVYQNLDAEKLSPTLAINYKARDGLTIPAFLTTPSGKPKENLPTIIIPNEYLTERINWRFNYIVQYLVAKGYAVLQINYRGTDGYGKEFENSGSFELGGKILEDINDSAKWIVDKGIADKDKVCILGKEYSGYAALQTNVIDDSIYKCAIAIDPLINFKKFVRGIDSNFIEKRGVDYETMSPYHRADEIKSPLLLIWEQLVFRRDAFEQENFIKKVRKNGIEVESYTVEDLNVNNRARVLLKISEFLEEQFR